MLQLVASVLLIGIGLYVGVFAEASSDMRLFGGILGVLGLLGLVAASLLRRRHDG
jgi:MYXO-CTERM domain-containing protein